MYGTGSHSVRVIANIAKEMNLKLVGIDYLGNQIKLGPNLYSQLLEGMASKISDAVK